METVLVIAPHPDDEVLGCGATIARHIANGDRVYVQVITRGIPELFPAAEIEGTRVELKAAHELLGITETTFLDFPAPKLDVTPGHLVADGIRKYIHQINATIMYVPHSGDIHLDHRAVHLAALVAARPHIGCPVHTILSYETLSETDWAPPTPESAFIPNVYIDVSHTIGQKIAAMRCYASQLKAFPNTRSIESLEALARMRGGTIGVAAAEAFMLIRQTQRN